MKTEKPPETVLTQAECPHCGKSFKVSTLVGAPETATLHLVLRGEEGHMQSLKTLGGTLLNLDKALVATGKQLNAKTVALVRNVTITGPEIDVEVMIANTASAPIKPASAATTDSKEGV